MCCGHLQLWDTIQVKLPTTRHLLSAMTQQQQLDSAAFVGESRYAGIVHCCPLQSITSSPSARFCTVAWSLTKRDVLVFASCKLACIG